MLKKAMQKNDSKDNINKLIPGVKRMAPKRKMSKSTDNLFAATDDNVLTKP